MFAFMLISFLALSARVVSLPAVLEIGEPESIVISSP